MQVQKFGLVDWVARGKRVDELDAVHGIEVLWDIHGAGEEKRSLVRIFLKPEPDEIDEELGNGEDVDLVMARIQGEERTYIKNNYQLAWIGMFDRWRPGGVWFRNPEFEYTEKDFEFFDSFKKRK